eukprot:TRINITY_DN14927_c0_g1_i1.p1 TRINITY_DN14927_c0_g1~~TRINITY_DN14927_c0_g1_i1.p1  ORF type:complete len:522 (-),score=107.07 TRINITY_DN14927_c0_g1_i1:416-1981(-)
MVGNGAAAAMEVASSAATCGGLPLSTLKTKFPVSACTSNDNTDDRGWALKRDWTDSDFQEGADKNREQLQSFEDVLVARLRQSCARHIGGETPAVLDDKGNDACEIGKDEREQVEKEAKIDGKADNVLARALRPLAPSSDKDPPAHVRDAVLNDPAVLGSSLDIVGAYLKNYEVDKAAAVIETVLPACRSRGGLWYLKALNHLATVRMKQARPTEALSTLSEIESYALLSLRPEEMDEAWEFWETVYRNFGWALSSLDRETEAIGYIQRAIGVKERVGKAASWFDLWDLGRMQACSALRTNNSKEIQESQAVVTKALWLHRDAEASDLVMRAKIWHSVGECSFALGHLTEVRPGGSSSSLENPNAKASSSQARTHYTKALKCLKEAHKLFVGEPQREGVQQPGKDALHEGVEVLEGGAQALHEDGGPLQPADRRGGPGRVLDALEARFGGGGQGLLARRFGVGFAAAERLGRWYQSRCHSASDVERHADGGSHPRGPSDDGRSCRPGTILPCRREALRKHS